MARYDETSDETWDLGVPTDKGFPYEFPFYFDRENTRSATDLNEDWGTAVDQTGRYGIGSDETWDSDITQTGRYGAEPT